MKHSNIIYAPRYYQEKRNQNQKSPFPSSRNNRMPTMVHTPHGQQPLNRSILGTSRIDNIQNIPKIQSSCSPMFNNFNTLGDGRLSHNNSMISIHPNVNYQENKPTSSKKIQQLQFTEILKDLSSKMDKIVMKISQNNQRLDNVQKQIFINNKQTKISQESFELIKQKILNQINSNTQRQNTSSFINSIQIYIEALKDQIFEFNRQLFERKQNQIINVIKNVVKVDDRQFQKKLQNKINSQNKTFKENINEQILSLKNKLQSELYSKISNKLINQTSTSKSTYQYPYRPILLRYSGSLKICDPIQTQKHRNNNEKQIDSQELIYYIDPQGYLLDKECYYILDMKGSKIRLPQKQVEIICGRKITQIR